MTVGGTTWGAAAALSIGGSNTFDISTTSAGSDQPYFSGYWSYTPSADATLHLDTEGTTGTSPDTFLAVYTGATDPGTFFDSDDDAGSGFLSSLDVVVTGGTTYHIRAGTYDSSGGGVAVITLTASLAAPPPPPPCWSIGGVQWPLGAQSAATAVEIGDNPAVTIGGPGYALDDASHRYDGYPHMWWRWTAPETGVIKFDTTLSYVTATGLSTSANILVGTSPHDPPLDSSDVTTTVASGFGTVTANVVAGTVYYIVVYDYGTLGATGLILRISDYGSDSGWVQPADQSYVLSPPTAWTSSPWHAPSTIPVGNPNISEFTDGFYGHYDLAKPFGAGAGDARNPALVPDPDAIHCLWAHATKTWEGPAYWTVDGSAGGATPGVCQAPGAFYALAGAPVLAVGGTYSGTLASGGVGGGYADAIMDVYGVAQRVHFSSALTFWGPTGGLAAPSAGVGGAVEYEATQATLLGADASPDETVHGEGTDIAVEWYGKVVPFAEGDGEWGPFQDNTGGGGLFMGGPPAAFPAKQDFQLTDFPVAPSTAPAWETIDSTVLADALAEEALSPAGGLRFVSQFPEMKQIDPPGQLKANAAPAAVNDYRNEQFVAIRMHVRPPRYRLRSAPVLPPVLPCGGYLRIQPRDDALNAGTALRQFPPEKQSIRVHGGYPGGPGA